MKKSLLTTMVLFAITSVTLTSCKKEEKKPTKNIVEIAQGNSEFSILVQALTRTDLSVNYATVLAGDGPFTVFAPTNAAFQALLTELGVASLNDIPSSTLESVLQYHVVNGKVLSGALTEGQKLTAINGYKLTVSLSGGAKLTDESSRESNITTTDIEATNGVIHAIDRVLLPNP